MATSPQNYIDELYKQGQGKANELHTQRQQADEEFIRQVNEAIDRSTASSTKSYQSQVEQLPGQYQKLYDANAVQELIGRRQVQETMANMGLTDSGLNRTQQTALSLQRGNADASARQAQQQKTQELQDKIAQLIETGAAQKQQQEAGIRSNTSNWFNELLNSTYNNSVQQGTSRYNSEKEAEAQVAAAQAAALEKQRAAQAEALAKQRAAVDEWNLNLIKNGDDETSPLWRRMDSNGNVVSGGTGSGQAQPGQNSSVKTARPGDSGFVGPLEQKKINIGDFKNHNTNLFKASIMRSSDFAKRKHTTRIDGISRTFDSYKEYVDAMLDSWFSDGKLTEEETAYLIAEFGL